MTGIIVFYSSAFLFLSFAENKNSSSPQEGQTDEITLNFFSTNPPSPRTLLKPSILAISVASPLHSSRVFLTPCFSIPSALQILFLFPAVLHFPRALSATWDLFLQFIHFVDNILPVNYFFFFLFLIVSPNSMNHKHTVNERDQNTSFGFCADS
uniref:Secreted protein n=1 Tax=Lutzomyia longipalpis TaxID=7200 RepID=A0A7G3B818_LUTLO